MQINPELADKEYGIKNAQSFFDVIELVYTEYVKYFGEELMSRYDLYVDNATKGSGYTPITLVAGDNCVLIKLNIEDDAEQECVVYQFAHELTHYVFKAIRGIKKPLATEGEEAVCMAASLIMIKELYGEISSEKWLLRAKGLTRLGYKKGIEYAEKFSNDMNKLKEFMYSMKIYAPQDEEKE